MQFDKNLLGGATVLMLLSLLSEGDCYGYQIIRELAERMIQLYAPREGRKVDIVYVGLRPGEKLYEELLLAGEGIAKTENEKIFIAKPEVFTQEQIEDMLARLKKCLDEEGDMLACMHALVPTFRKAEEVNKAVEKSAV